MSSAKEYEKFEKKLGSILSSASSAKSWSDLLPITKDILKHLTKYQDIINYAKIENKYILAKRLAQCLNPECLGGVHEVVLNIYQVLLHNIISMNERHLKENLGIYACGLFPFFPNASLPNKEKFLNVIVKEHFFCMDVIELSLCLPGLLASLIPGLDDNNEKTTQIIYTCFDDIKNKVKDRTFYGTYWTLLLRNEHLR